MVKRTNNPNDANAARKASQPSRSDFTNKVFFKSSDQMTELPDNSVDLVVTSPPYFNIKDYSSDGYQRKAHSKVNSQDIGSHDALDKYLTSLLAVWTECERVLLNNGKLCINVPLMPMPKKVMSTHFNRDIIDLQSSIQQSILRGTGLYLLDLYIWNRTNSSKRLMFGSYPYPRNFYAQNTTEFLTVYVKDGPSISNVSKSHKEKSKLTQEEYLEYTKQIWNIPSPNKSDPAFGIHPAIMPDELAKRCIRLYSFVGDLVLDPFAGSGTTLKVAAELDRNYVGYEIYDAYSEVINKKLGIGTLL